MLRKVTKVCAAVIFSGALALSPNAHAEGGFSGGGTFGDNQGGGFSGGGAWCPNGYYGFSNFDQLRSYLDNHYPRSGRIWQAPSNNEVWDVWCHVTNGEGFLSDSEGATPNEVFLDDNTRVNFRTKSKSGGYTIDIKTGKHTKLFKVHVA